VVLHDPVARQSEEPMELGAAQREIGLRLQPRDNGLEEIIWLDDRDRVAEDLLIHLLGAGKFRARLGNNTGDFVPKAIGGTVK
jgi:hypothetical protein